jgi:NADH-quinone oxidoreductase subunit B
MDIDKKDSEAHIKNLCHINEDENLSALKAQDIVCLTKAESFVDYILNWANSKVLFPLNLGSSCCSIEFNMAHNVRDDFFNNFGEGPKDSPEMSDLMIIAGHVTPKLLPFVVESYRRMQSPKWTILMGSCALSGGAYHSTTVSNIKDIIPIDIYVPGCPPAPESLVSAVQLLKSSIQNSRGLQ